MYKTPEAVIEISTLHEPHPQIRAKDFESPLVRRLLRATEYRDGSCSVLDSFRPPASDQPTERSIDLSWKGLHKDFDQVLRTYQEPRITELATLGLACILVAHRAGLEITEVTRVGDRADYWLGDKQFLLEVSGQQSGTIDALCSEKAGQLLENPFSKSGYVCVAVYDQPRARLWFYTHDETEASACQI
jgi:hypothetical protein